MKLSFHGADRTVTGSCHLLECRDRRVLIDCGLFQGSREIGEENAEPLGFDPATVDFVLLTHAHLDHCGRLPLLAKAGFRGEVIATAATFELARLVILDAARLQEEDTRHRHHGTWRQGEQVSAQPLYSARDAEDVVARFGRAAAYDTALDVVPGIRATFLDAGHIVGSASILLAIEENGRRRTVLFSGDIGNSGRPLLRSPQVPDAAEIVIMETTYGDRRHRRFDASVEELIRAVAATLERGGNVLIPTFALERAQEVLYFLREGVEKNRLPRTLPVFLDSPMAISATEIFRRHPECFAPKPGGIFGGRTDPFVLPELRMTRETPDSAEIDHIHGGAVILAGSGMCTGGRIRHHLQANLGREASSVIFVGFAAKGTLARQIIDGARQVQVLGTEVPVRARIHTINGFSAHADQRELLDWHNRIGGGRRATFLVHGEAAVMKSFAQRLTVPRIEMPALHQEFEL